MLVCKNYYNFFQFQDTRIKDLEAIITPGLLLLCQLFTLSVRLLVNLNLLRSAYTFGARNSINEKPRAERISLVKVRYKLGLTK